MRKRVVVTGLGAVCSAGQDVPEYVEALRAGRPCFSALSDPRLAELRATHAGLVAGFGPDPADPPELRSLDRHVRLALRALGEALSRAGLGGRRLGPRAAVVFGTCSGGMLSIERRYEQIAAGGGAFDETWLFSMRYHSAARVLAWASGAGGPALTVATACASGSGAIAQAADLIRAGIADIALAGGGDSFALSTLAGFDALKATAVGIGTPFSHNVGLNLGEGAAFLVLESLEHARERNASLLAELLGYGLSNDAHHPTAPDPSARGQVAAMERALADAGVSRNQVDYVNAHGTGTRSNDPIESKAIRRVLQERADQVPTSSTKSMIGHCLGGAGALEAAATIASARAGFVPPTAGFTGPRDGCGLADYVPDTGRPWSGRVALSNSFGFAGNNAALLFDVAPDADQPTARPGPPPGGATVITGIGVVSPRGAGLARLAQGSGSALEPIRRFPVPADPFPAGLVPDIDPRDLDRRLDLRGTDRCSRYATMAVWGALDQAGLRPRPSGPHDVGMVLGIANGPSEGEADHMQAILKAGFRIDSVGAFPFVVPNSVAGNVSRTLMLRGHSTVLAAGQGAGLAALISAAVAREQGHGERIVAAASDELTERTVRDGFETGLFGPGTGAVPGEGACALVVEREEGALARGAAPVARILGWGLATSNADIRRPERDALVGALRSALGRAGLSPGDIRRVATGACAPEAVAVEAEAIAAVFGDRRSQDAPLAGAIGAAEASLALFQLAGAIASGEPGSAIACTALSQEGFASALVVALPRGSKNAIAICG